MAGKEKDNLSAILVIFGGTGDLTNRKLMPALYNLVLDKLLPEHFAVVSIGRQDKTEEEYKKDIYESTKKHSRNKIDDTIWDELQRKIHYYRFDFTNAEGFIGLKDYLDMLDGQTGAGGNRVFYLAVAPVYFETIVHGLQISDMASKPDAWSRLVIEKPFGKDLKTARNLNSKILEVFSERDIYRIDHYLGKEMIQNIMVLRFCNSIFESIWNNKFIDNIQISLTEELGVGARGDYYDHAGAMRDMVQNHIIQILSLVALEPPINLKTDSIRTEKQKILEAIEDITPEFLRDNVVFGQYGPGVIDGSPVVGYREELNVPEDSGTETFVALKLHINNFRWAGIPFYIRTGKRLGQSSSNIVVQFKDMPKILYFKDKEIQDPNLLVLRIQPNVGVYFQFNTKDFSSHHEIVPTKMDTSYFSPTQGNTPEAYERLIHDILRGDSTLFSRWDEVEAAWMFADHLIQYREQNESTFPNYAAGSMGPEEAFELMAKDGRKWWQV
ncbi:glucose-6-phosphate dehydrogenase [Parasporobacterium paucivorans]|uniref:Glucose-6-phosphate 1-dehydrogenase n=1 Tax=Parasporobacterium paucivorans DSM 15970 TaxID=1122934 RepID=A0A1M6ISW1_9FIRM|nr:glucose-6-phosphate dehydrogenase [Parasporobacterium paucivorans]SHJ37514.1 glucose-6-phosphate 1-dehydrogenase [Parasporobacterium paucivorans DSM 15970]